MTKWHKRFINLALEVAGWSKENKKVGCVFVDRNTNKVLSMGFNGLPRAIDDNCLSSLEQSDKSLLVLHAEHNALDQLAKEDYHKEIDVYITKPPCHLCALKLANSLANIKTIYYIPFDNPSFSGRYNFSETERILGSRLQPIENTKSLYPELIIGIHLNTLGYELDWIDRFVSRCTDLVNNLDDYLRLDTSQVDAFGKILEEYPPEKLLQFVQEEGNSNAKLYLEWYVKNK